jgi:hypothetical protein
MSILVVFKNLKESMIFMKEERVQESLVLGWVILILIIFVDSNLFIYLFFNLSKQKEPIRILLFFENLQELGIFMKEKRSKESIVLGG